MARKQYIDYIWDKMIMPQAGYSFSKLHTVSYSWVAIQEALLATEYPVQYWNASVLSVLSGATKEDGSTDYSKMARAVSNMQSKGVVVDLPSISRSGLRFTADKEANKVLFGLSGITGINSAAANEITTMRPFLDFEDFYTRMYEGEKVTRGMMLSLIKSGTFNEFGDRFEIMKEFITLEYIPKVALDMKNFARVTKLGLYNDNDRLRYLATMREFNTYIAKNGKVLKNTVKPKSKHILLPETTIDWYFKNFDKETRALFEVMIEDEVPVVSTAPLKKYVDKYTEELKQWVSSDSTIQLFNRAEKNEMWKKYAVGSIADWEMSTLCYYNCPHPLLQADLKRYGVESFTSKPEKPEVVYGTSKNGRKTKRQVLTRIAGTIIDKNSTKHTVTLLTLDGVVTCKYYAGLFEVYNKELKSYKTDKKGEKKGTVVEKSWFTRGKMMILTGFRRDDQFIVRSQKSFGESESSTILITQIMDDGQLALRSERARV